MNTELRPVITTAAEYGARGAAKAHAMYRNPRTWARWGRMGGRPRELTLAEHEAATAATRRKSRKGGTAIELLTTNRER